MTLKDIFENKGFVFKEFESSKDAVEDLKARLKDRSITFGGSLTCEQLNLYEILGESNEVAWHWKDDGIDTIDKDVYIASTNALTKDGKLVNFDGRGNRVSNMVFGHKDVYIICGINKVVDDYEQAIERIENVAAPLNYKRRGEKINDIDDIYVIESIIHKNPSACQIHIYLINEELGY